VGITSQAGRYGGTYAHKPERLKRLNQIAIRQMQTLTAATALRQIEPPKDRKD